MAEEKALALRTGERLLGLDLHRGIIMVLMAIDHASIFIARAHSREFWGSGLPVYPDVFWFLTRFATHISAPGFFFLMGMGMSFLHESRRKAGWGWQRTAFFFALRGALLVALQLVVENAAWFVGDLPAQAGSTVVRGGPLPGGGGGGVFIYLGVLYCLGATMVFWAFLVNASGRIVATVSMAALLMTPFTIPGPEQAGTLFSPLLRLLLIPGRTGALIVFYPLVPWLGVTGLGIVFGRWMREDRQRAGRAAVLMGAGLLLVLPLLRFAGEFPNLNEVPPGLMGFLNMVKYPPSLSFLALTLGMNFLLVALWPVMERHFGKPMNLFVIFGRTPLFFYLVHLWVYGLVGFFFPRGSSLPVMYGVWVFGLIILYPLCREYLKLRNTTPATSLWRLF